MKKTRDPILINNVATYLEEQSSDLKNAQLKLLNHINNIFDSYKGNDAVAIINKFNEITKKLNSVIQNIDYYNHYMKSVSSYDSENLNETLNDLNTINNQSTSINHSLNQTFNFNINNGGDLNG